MVNTDPHSGSKPSCGELVLGKSTTPTLWNTEQQNKIFYFALTKRMKGNIHTQATEGEKCHWGAFNVEEELYKWAGSEDLIELSKVTTCIHFREEMAAGWGAQPYVFVCVCAMLLSTDKMYSANSPGTGSFSSLLKNEVSAWDFKEKKKTKTPHMHTAMWFELGRFPSGQMVQKSQLLASWALPACALASHRLNLPSSQQQAVNFPLPHCGLGSIQECFTRLWVWSHTLVALANLPSNVTKPCRGTKNQFQIPQCRIWNLNNLVLSPVSGCNFSCEITIAKCWDLLVREKKEPTPLFLTFFL